MNTEVKPPTNLPPRLVAKIDDVIDRARPATEPLSVEQLKALGDELCEEIERAWDANQAPLLPHLRSASYNLGQLRNRFDLELRGTVDHIEAAQHAVATTIDLLEQHR